MLSENPVGFEFASDFSFYDLEGKDAGTDGK